MGSNATGLAAIIAGGVISTTFSVANDEVSGCADVSKTGTGIAGTAMGGSMTAVLTEITGVGDVSVSTAAVSAVAAGAAESAEG